MAFTQTEGLRDREYAKFEAVQTGSKVGVLVIETNPVAIGSLATQTIDGVISGTGAWTNTILYATASGTGTLTPVLCDANGIILTSGIN